MNKWLTKLMEAGKDVGVEQYGELTIPSEETAKQE